MGEGCAVSERQCSLLAPATQQMTGSLPSDLL